jgi:hypothetical protein
MRTAFYLDGSPEGHELGTFKLVLELPNFVRQPKANQPKAIITRPNPLILVAGWQKAIKNGEVGSKAQLAAKLGLTRARITQLFDILELAPEAREWVINLGDPLQTNHPSIRFLRGLLTLPAGEQVKKLMNHTNVMRTDKD